MELVDIYNDKHEKLNYTKGRKELSDGEFRLSCFVWIINDKDELLIQQRLATAKKCPNMWETTSGGAIAGDDAITGTLRELEEELGIKAEPEQLHFMGLHEGKCEEIFYGKPFKNHEISHVYLYSEPINIKELKLQEEEVQEVCWMDFETCCEKVKSGDKKYCLFPEELKMIKEYLKI